MAAISLEDLLEYLDGRGLIITDTELIDEALKEINLSGTASVEGNQ